MRLGKEGYTPCKTAQQRTKVWTYNCQLANESRIRQWSEEFRDAYVLMQGTQRRYEASHGEKALQQWRTDYHMIYEVKVPKNYRGHRPDGVLVMVLLGVMSIVTKVLVPKEKAIEARGLAVRVSRGQYDLCLCTVYCPLGTRDPDGQRKTEKL